MVRANAHAKRLRRPGLNGSARVFLHRLAPFALLSTFALLQREFVIGCYKKKQCIGFHIADMRRE